MKRQISQLIETSSSSSDEPEQPKTFMFLDLCPDLQRFVLLYVFMSALHFHYHTNLIRFTNKTIFSVGCVSKSIADLIEKTLIYRDMRQFRGYYDKSYCFPNTVVSDARLIKLKPTILKLDCHTTPTHDTIKTIAPNLTSLSLLDSIGESDIHEGMSSIIATMTNLTELRVVDFSNEPDYFTTLPALPKLKKLSLVMEWCYGEPSVGGGGGYDWNILKNVPNLESLEARPTCDALDFSKLTCLTKLRDLYVEPDDLKVDENIKCLKTFQSLKNIRFFMPIEQSDLNVLKSIPEGLDVHYSVEQHYSSSSISDSDDDDDDDDDSDSDSSDSSTIDTISMSFSDSSDYSSDYSSNDTYDSDVSTQY